MSSHQRAFLEGWFLGGVFWTATILMINMVFT